MRIPLGTRGFCIFLEVDRKLIIELAQDQR
jgi:hypothetical protein